MTNEDGVITHKCRIIINLNPLMKSLFADQKSLKYIVNRYIKDEGYPSLENVDPPKEPYRLRIADDLYKQMRANPQMNYWLRDLAVLFTDGYEYVKCNNTDRVYDFIFKKPLAETDSAVSLT